MFGNDAPLFGLEFPLAIRPLLQTEHTIAQDDVGTPFACRDGKGMRGAVSIHVALVCVEQAALETARIDEWTHLRYLLGRDQGRLHVHRLVHRTLGFEHLPAFFGGGEAYAAGHVQPYTLAALTLDVFVETDRVALQCGDVRIVIESVETCCGVPCGSGGEFAALDECYIAPTVAREVIQHASADDTAANHHNPIMGFHLRRLSGDGYANKKRLKR